MRVQLTRKLANCLDGIDLSRCRVGDVLTMSRREAELLVAEGWARRVRNRSDRASRACSGPSTSVAAPDPSNRQRVQQLQHAVDHYRFEPHAYRRVEDRLRDELHDARARIIKSLCTSRSREPLRPTSARG